MGTDPYVLLAAELGHLGRRVDAIGGQLLRLRADGTGGVSRTEDAPAGGGVAPAGWTGAAWGAVPGVPLAGGAPGRPPIGAGQVGSGVAGPAAAAAAGSPSGAHPSGGGAEAAPGARPVPAGAHPGGASPWAQPGGAVAPWPPPPTADAGASSPVGAVPGAPGAGGGWVGGPAGGWVGGPADGRGGGPAGPPRPARRRTAVTGARLLAWTGAAVTLLGVVLLLVLAASRGWFAPPARVALGAALGVALVAVGARLHRRETARTGAVALAGTGFAALLLVLAAATALYGYLAAAPALVLALLVASAGLGFADRWRAAPLAVGVVVGTAALAPAVADGWLLVALALALQLAALPVVLRRRWPVLLPVSGAWPVLFGLGVTARDTAALPASALAAVVAVLVVGSASAAAAARVLAAAPVAVLVAGAPLPVLVAASTTGGARGAAFALVAAVVAAALAALPDGGRVVRTTAVAVAAVALLLTTVLALDGASLTLAVLGEALVVAVLAAVRRRPLPLVVALALGALGVAAALDGDAPPPVAFPTPASVVVVAVAALVVALAVALLVAGGRVGWVRPTAATAGLWVPIGLAGLYGATTLVVALALLVAPDRAGFTAGHALVTVSWTAAALVLLARGLTRPALRTTGLVLVAAAVAKLVLFDLVALDGLARVAAFLGAGLVLLAAGTRYARLVAEAERATPAEPTA